MTAIAVERLTKRYGDLTAVDDVSFEVGVGEVVSLLGPNGAGKTTTIEVLEGFLAPDSGTVRVLGAGPGERDRRWRSRIGLVLQSTSLDSQLTAREVVGAFARLFPRPRSVDEALALVGLVGASDVRIGELSGGQQRRVDLAIGLVGRPELLFLDEPTTGLDPAARRETWSVIEDVRAHGTTVLLSTHYLDEAEHLADRVLVLANGRLVADDTPEAIRAASARTTIRYALPPRAPVDDLAPVLLEGLDLERNELILRTGEVTETLVALVGWARRHGVDLNGLEVGAPSLEDAYLTLVERDG